MPIYKNPITIVQGAPTPSTDYPTQTYFEPTASVPSAVTKSGNYFSTNENVAHCHLLKQDAKTIVTVRQSTMNEFRVIVKFKTPLNYTGAIFGGNLGGWECPYGVVRDNGTVYISYANTSTTEYVVTAGGIIEANKWYYVSSTFYKDQKLVCLCVYDENGALLFGGAKGFVGNLYDNGAKTFLIGGIGSQSGISPAKDFNIDLDETLLELDNNVVWGQTNSKTQNMGVFHFDDWNEFTEVEYIESTGTQYIDTGFNPNSNSRFVVDLFCDARTSDYQIIGSRYAYGDRCFAIALTNNTIVTDYGAVRQNPSLQTNRRMVIDKDKNVTKVDGNVLATSTSQTFSCPISSTIFVWKQNAGVMTTFSKAKLYSAKIYDNGTIVRDFVPCYHTMTGVIGLFDTVNNKFYTNAGTGDFLKGADV